MATVAPRLKFALLITVVGLAAFQSSERDATAQDPPNRMVKFVINPRTNAVVFGDEFDFHDELASRLADYNVNDGYVGGTYVLKDGKSDIRFRPGDIKNEALKRRWSGSFAAEFLRQKAGQPEFAQFHGAKVLVATTELGYFDSRSGRGVVPAEPPPLPPMPTVDSRGRATAPAAAVSREPFFPPREAAPAAATPAPASEAIAPIVADVDPALPSPTAIDPPAAVLPPGPTDPSLEARIEQFLRGHTPESLRAKFQSGRWEVFADPLFKHPGDAKARQVVARTWKKVCAKPEFTALSEVLARYRWELITDTWGEISLRYGLLIELINSGKRNAYRSDVDVTVYSPLERRRGIAMSELMKDFSAAFARRTQGAPPDVFDITIHDGDIFMPDTKNHGQQYFDYMPALRETVRKLRLKIADGGDAYVAPGGNLYEVQRRGLQGQVVLIEGTFAPTRTAIVVDVLPDGTRQRRVVALESRAVIRQSPPLPVSYLDPSTGGWRTNSSRFEGIEPVYDRRGAFGETSNSFDNMIEHVDDPAMVGKYSTRAVNSGIGGTEVNSYVNLHVSTPQPPDYPLPFGTEWPLMEAIRDAAQNDAKVMEDFREEEAYYRERYERKRVEWIEAQQRALKQQAKQRWISRVFGVPLTEGTELQRIQALLDANADIDLAKARGEFDWATQAKRYLGGYWEKARSALTRPYGDAARQELNNQGVIDNDPNNFNNRRQPINDIVNRMAVEEARRTRPDLQGLSDTEALNRIVTEAAFQLHVEETRNLISQALVLEATRAMKDMTPKRMVYNSFRFVKDPATGRPIALSDSEAGLKLAEQRKLELVLTFDVLNRMPDQALAAVLREQFINAAPPEIKPEVVRLSKISGARLDYFMRLFEQPGPVGETPLQRKQRAVDAALAGLDVPIPPDGPPAEDLARQKARRFIEKVGGSGVRFVKEFGTGFAQSTPFAKPPANPDPFGPNRVVDHWTENFRNLNLLMVSSSAVNLSLAYASNDSVRFNAALLSEIAMYMPPAYGLVATLLQDFATIRDVRDTESFRWMKPIGTVGFFYALAQKPILGEFLLGVSATSHLIIGSYAIAVSNMNNDIVTQAFKSRPVKGLDHAAPARNADRIVVTAQDTPREPLLFEYDKCTDPSVTMKTDFDWQAPNAATAGAMFGAAITRDLHDAKLTPGTSAWAREEARLIERYMYDLPYYVRMSRIYRCFRGAFTTDYYNQREARFTEVVNEWFDAQPPEYRKQFDSVWDFFARPGHSSSDLIRRAFVHMLIEEYEKYMFIESRLENSAAEVGVAIKMHDALAGKLENRLWIATEQVSAGIEKAEAARLAPMIKQSSQPAVARVRVEAPSWYLPVRLSGLATTALTGTRREQVTLTPTASGAASLGEGGIDLGDDAPVDIVVAASRDKYPAPWEAKLSVALGQVQKRAPDGFVPTADEQRLLAARRPDGSLANSIVTIPLLLTADVYDARRQLIARSPATPVVTYAIAPIPQLAASILVKVEGTTPGSPQGAATTSGIEADVQLGPANQATAAASDGVQLTSFQGLKPGRYTITARSRNPQFGAGSATIDIPNPFTLEAYRAGAPAQNEFVVEVTLPFIGKPAAATTPASPPAVATPPAVAPGANASRTCENQVNEALDRKERGDLAGAQRALERARTQCASVPGGPSIVSDAATVIGGSTSNANSPAASTGVGTPGVGPRAPAAPPTPPAPPATPPVTRNPSTTTSPTSTTQLAAECAEILAKARDLLSQGNAGLAANWLGQAQQKHCALAGPEVGAGVTEQLGNLEGILQGLIEGCDLTSAFAVAQQARAAFSSDPRLAAWLDRNLQMLQRQAEAQRQARDLIATAESAIRQRNVPAAIAALQSALNLPDLPPCMRNSITTLLGDLGRRTTFGNLVDTLVAKTDACEVDEAVAIMRQLQAIQPRDETMDAWFRLNKQADIDALKKRFDRAAVLKGEAETLSRSATTQSDWDAVINKLELARGTALACGAKLGIDPALTAARGRRPLTTSPPSNPPTPPTPPRPPVTPPPPPVAPPPLPPAASLKCTLVAAPDIGYQGDQVELTIEIDPRVAAQVTRVTTSNPGCPGCAANQAGTGRFTLTLFLTGQPEISLVSRKPAPLSNGGGSFTAALPGMEKRVPISFTAFDAANRNVCTGTADVKFGGTRQ